MTEFLVGHVLDEEAVLSSEALPLEVRDREPGQTPVEEIKLDVLLVQSKGNRLVVEVGQHAVDRRRAIGVQTTRWGVRGGLVGVKPAVGRILVGIWSGRESRDGRGKDASVQSTGCCGCSPVRTVRGYVGDGNGWWCECGSRHDGGVRLRDDGYGDGRADQSQKARAC